MSSNSFHLAVTAFSNLPPPCFSCQKPKTNPCYTQIGLQKIQILEIKELRD